MIAINKLDKKICKMLQNDIPMVKQPFRKLANELNISEKKLLERIKKLKKRGLIKRLSALLKHQMAGYRTNVLVVWKVSKRRIKQVARICIRFSQISHCYQRRTCSDWHYNLYTMIHGHNKKECERVIKLIVRKNKIKDYKLLYTRREYKKVSTVYF